MADIYGILDLSYYAANSRVSKDEVYVKEVDLDVLNLIDEVGYEEASKIFEEKNPNKYLIHRNRKGIAMIFQPGAGGNFLLNCLLLSDYFLIDGLPTIEDRCQYLCFNYDNETTRYWNDTSMLRHLSELEYHLAHPFDVNVKRICDFWPEFDTVILIKNSFLFIAMRKWLAVFSPEDEKDYFQAKTQSKTNFINNTKRRKKLSKLLFNHNINISSYKKFYSKNKDKFQEVFNDKKSTLRQNYSYCKLKTKKQIYFWDANWNLDEEEFIFNLENMYIGLGLTGFNQDIVSKCYRSWINAMIRCFEINNEHDINKKNMQSKEF